MIDKVGQKFQGKLNSGSTYTVVERISGTVGWIVQREGTPEKIAVTSGGQHFGAYGGFCTLLGDEIVPLKLEVGKAYSAKNGSKYLIIKEEKSVFFAVAVSCELLKAGCSLHLHHFNKDGTRYNGDGDNVLLSETPPNK